MIFLKTQFLCWSRDIKRYKLTKIPCGTPPEVVIVGPYSNVGDTSAAQMTKYEERGSNKVRSNFLGIFEFMQS